MPILRSKTRTANGGAGPTQVRRVLSVTPVGMAVAAGMAWVAPWQLTVLAAWTATAATLLLRIWLRIGGFDSTQTKAFATREDDSRAMTELLLLFASSGALVAVAFGLAKANKSHGLIEALLIAVSAGSIIVSWGIINTTFTTRYASAYYADPVGGIDFNNDEDPVYVDFAYLAATIGMTFQVSDTDIAVREVRRIIIRHALLSFVFVTAIIASSINVLASLLNQ